MLILEPTTSMPRPNRSVFSSFHKTSAITDRLTDSIALRDVARGDMDNDVLQRAATLIAQACREDLVLARRFLNYP